MALEPSVYQRWWPLHLRAARGEVLDAEDETFYRSILHQQDQEEVLADQGQALKEARAAIAALEAEHAALEAQRRQVQSEIGALEKLLERRTVKSLGGKG